MSWWYGRVGSAHCPVSFNPGHEGRHSHWVSVDNSSFNSWRTTHWECAYVGNTNVGP